MMHPMPSGPSSEDSSRPAVRTRRVLNVRILIGTFLALMALGTVAHFWRAYQVRRQAVSLTERAESLAKEQDYSAATFYYTRYLELHPDDAGARMRRAELYDQTTGRMTDRAIGLYQEALSGAGKGLEVEKRVKAQRRLTELLLQSKNYAPALTEAGKLSELERNKESATPAAEWYAPSLRALALAGEQRVNRLAVSDGTLQQAFDAVLEPKAGETKPHVLPEVYLARFEYRLKNHLRDSKDPNAGDAYLEAFSAAKGDLETAVKMAPQDPSTLLSAAVAAQRVAAAALLALREGSPARAAEYRDIASTSYIQAIDYFQRAASVAPADPRPYLGLGQLYMSMGNATQAAQTWRLGLKEVPAESMRAELSLSLVDALLQLGSLSDAENVLRSLDGLLAKVDPRSHLALRRLVDLRSGKLAFQRGRYEEAIHLVTDLATGKVVIQGEESAATPQMRYEAWMLLGQAHANLRKWDAALGDFEHAADLSPREASPHLSAAETCILAGRRDAAIAAFLRALEVLDAAKPAPVGQELVVYAKLVALLDEKRAELTEKQKNKGLDQKQRDDLEEEAKAVASKAELYRGHRKGIIAASAQLTLLAVNELVGAGKVEQAISIAEDGVKAHPEDALVYMALGRAERAAKRGDKATDAYRRAIELAKNAPDSQMELAEMLLTSGDPGDAAEGEKLLRDLLPRHPPAILRLTRLLASRQKYDEALAIAQNAVKNSPKDSLSHLSLGVAWCGKSENAKAETEFQEAVSLAPDAPGPGRVLLEFYVDTGRTELARQTLDKLLAKFKQPDVDRELFRAEMLARIGDRKEAKRAYQKAVEIAKEDPPITMRLAEFLLRSGDPAEEAEGEKLLRHTMPQYDPARRRLAQALIARGGEAEWEEAQKLLEQSAGNPISATDRFIEARLLMRRGGASNLEKAADICRDLLKGDRPRPEVLLLLAEIRELQGNIGDARKQYLALVDVAKPSPAQLAYYVVFLLRQGPAAEADERLKQLEKIAPEDALTVELRARWLRDQKRTAEIEPLVEGHAQKALAQLGKEGDPQEAQLARVVGDLYQRIELYSAAERWYRRLMHVAADMYEPLVMSLAKQGRIQEAVALCQEADKNGDSLRPALLVAHVLTGGHATLQDMKAAEPYLRKTLESHKDQPDLMSCLAAIRVLQDRPKDGIELYRQIVKLQPRNVSVLNNLATVLSEQPEPESRQEALECIEHAIELAGPLPDLLDTKGMIFFYDGKPERAVGPLQAAAESPSADPRFDFHLAAACWRLGQLDRARQALQRARNADLEHQLLTNKDRQLLVDLEKQLGQ